MDAELPPLGAPYRSQIGDSATSPTACYRLKPYFRNVGFACTTLFAVMGLASVFDAYINVDNSFPRPLLAAACFGLFWACFVLLGVWLLLLHRRYRLFITDDSMRQCGVVSDCTVTLSSIRELKWRRFPSGGSVRLSGADGTLKIELGNFIHSQRDELISFLRAAIPDDRQFGWPEFCRQFQDTPERRVMARRASWFVCLILAFHAIAFLVLWGLGFGNQCLLTALLNAAFLVYFYRKNRNRRSAPDDGEPSDARKYGLRAIPDGESTFRAP